MILVCTRWDLRRCYGVHCLCGDSLCDLWEETEALMKIFVCSESDHLEIKPIIYGKIRLGG